MAVKIFFPTTSTLSTITTSDTFLKELLGIWEEVNFEPEIISREHFLDQQLWHNSLIKIANKTVFFKTGFQREWFGLVCLFYWANLPRGKEHEQDSGPMLLTM